MKALRDPRRLLAEGLAAIREQFALARGFPPQVLEAAGEAARRGHSDHADWTGRRFVTLDPASSTDLDQAFAIEPAGADWLLHYAIADVPWFVDEGGPIDAEAWRRGATTYLPDGKVGLHPPVLSEGAASLLPDANRPAIVLHVRIAPDGAAALDGATRAIIRSRAKLAYETVRDEELPPGFDAIAARIAAAEQARGAARVDPPEQEVELDPAGHFTLRFRPQLSSERRNAALSLAANLAVADALQRARTGLFRVMAPPTPRAVERLRQTASAFHLAWPAAMPLADFEKTLDPRDPRAAAFLLAVRRAGNGAAYVPWRAGETPWHAAMAATYAHCTAPLRRLADRHVLLAVLAIARGKAVPASLAEAFQQLPGAMARAEARDGRIERAVVDLAEVALLANHEGHAFEAVVTDLSEDSARIQLVDLPVVGRVRANGVLPGAAIRVRLLAADAAQRQLRFERTA